jgi:hypothetical protein
MSRVSLMVRSFSILHIYINCLQRGMPGSPSLGCTPFDFSLLADGLLSCIIAQHTMHIAMVLVAGNHGTVSLV